MGREHEMTDELKKQIVTREIVNAENIILDLYSNDRVHISDKYMQEVYYTLNDIACKLMD